MISRRRPRGFLLGLILLAAASCARRETGESFLRPALPAASAPALLVLDLGSRAERDLLPLVGEGGGEGLYRVLREGPRWVLRAREEGPAGAGPCPEEIRAVRSGFLSLRGLLELGELDGADLRERDLQEEARGSPPRMRVLRFPDYERLVLRFGPGLTSGEATGLAALVDRETLAAALFERSGRPAGACLPGEPDRLGEPGVSDETPEGITLLVETGRPELWATAEKIAADWGRAGISSTLASLPRGAVRDRLGTGRFEAVLMAFTRDAPGASEAAAALVRSGWACSSPPEGAAGEEATLDRWFRETCRIFPLLSLDRVVGLREGLEGIAFDEVGRIDWSLIRIGEEP